MAWNVRPCLDPNNYMFMQAKPVVPSDARFAMLDSYPFPPSIRGLQETRTASVFAKRPFFSLFDQHEEDMDDKLMDFSSSHGEKKRRLTVEQVRSLEKSFETENKLEPERKTKLAQELGLQPRQVAVWFQNRRARWKAKQIERDYDDLKENFDAVVAEKQKLEAEIIRLKGKLEAMAKTNDNYGLQIAVKDESGEQETRDMEACTEPSQTVQSESVTEEEVSKKPKDFSTCSDVSNGNPGSPQEQQHAVNEVDHVNVYNEQQYYFAQFGQVMKYVEAEGSYETFGNDLVFNVEDPSAYSSLWD